MAAQPWKIYDTFKEYMADGTIDMDGHTFKMALAKGSYTPAAAHSRLSEVTQIDNGDGYVTGGKSLSAVTWATGLSAGQMKFDATTTGTKWSATAQITSVRIAVLYSDTATNDELVAYASLSASDFNIESGNSLTITPSANGFFTLA